MTADPSKSASEKASAEREPGQEQVNRVLEDVLNRARQLLGDDTLVSVVLFGSRARGSSRPDSDFDLLIVAQSLPGGAGRRELALDIAEVGFDYGLPVQVVLASTEETEGAVNTGAPLMFEIYDAHRVIYDKDNFFRNLVGDFTGLLETWQVRKIKDRVWEVPGLAAARL
jgi:predicted nucleotidyltransferase